MTATEKPSLFPLTVLGEIFNKLVYQYRENNIKLLKIQTGLDDNGAFIVLHLDDPTERAKGYLSTAKNPGTSCVHIHIESLLNNSGGQHAVRYHMDEHSLISSIF